MSNCSFLNSDWHPFKGQGIMIDKALEFFKNILETPSPSGDEQPVQKATDWFPFPSCSYPNLSLGKIRVSQEGETANCSSDLKFYIQVQAAYDRDFQSHFLRPHPAGTGGVLFCKTLSHYFHLMQIHLQELLILIYLAISMKKILFRN